MTGVTFVIEGDITLGDRIGPQVYTFECDSPRKLAELVNEFSRGMRAGERFIKIITN